MHLRTLVPLGAMVLAACTDGGGSSRGLVGIKGGACPPASNGGAAPPGPASEGLRFVDVTAAMGLSHQQWEAAAYTRDERGSRDAENRRRREEGAIMTAGASVVDVDRDGWEDLFVTRVGLDNMLHHNGCGAGFSDVAADVGLAENQASAGSLWGDVDRDGDLDLFVTSVLRNMNRLYLNNGDATFEERGDEAGVASRKDFSPLTNSSYGAALGDVDADGDLDIVVNQWQHTAELLKRGRTTVYRNGGTGRFEAANGQLGLDLTGVAGFTTTITDIDDDGRPDLLIAGDWGSSRLFLGTADGKFRDATRPAGVGTDENGMGSAVEDVDGDGDLDWFVTSIAGPEAACRNVEFGCSGNRLFLNEGAASFTDATDAYGVRDGGWGWGTAVADFDNDGDAEVVMTNGWESQSTYSPGAHALSYEPYAADAMRYWTAEGGLPLVDRAAAVGLTDTGRGKALLAFDYDRDGDLDLFVARTGDTPMLYRNDGGNRNAWLRVLPVGEDGLPAVGARVTVRPTNASMPMIAEVRAGDTYQGSRSPWAHFGLGRHAGPVSELTVTWPGGAKTLLSGVDSRREVVVGPDGIRDMRDNAAPR